MNLSQHYGKLYGRLSPEERREFNRRNKSYRRKYRRSYDRTPLRVERRRLYDEERALTQRFIREHPEVNEE